MYLDFHPRGLLRECISRDDCTCSVTAWQTGGHRPIGPRANGRSFQQHRSFLGWRGAEAAFA
jgi:hypothetical protein